MKSMKEFRKKIFRELSRENIIFIDFDDTLFATTWVDSYSDFHRIPFQNLNIKNDPDMILLENYVYSFLKNAMKFGLVYIVTNAGEGHVHETIRYFMPSVCELLTDIPVVYARSKYEGKFPFDTYEWKSRTFTEQLHKRGKNHNFNFKNVISIGDSLCEREALITSTIDINNILKKSIKFIEKPTIVHLQNQIRMIHKKFDIIIESKYDLDLMLDIMQIKKSSIF